MNIKNIYTRKGDNGQSLSPDGMKNKSDIIFDVFGTIDEAQAHVGMLYEMMLERFQDSGDSDLVESFRNSKDDDIEEIVGSLRLVMSQLSKISGCIFAEKDTKDIMVVGIVTKIELLIDLVEKKLTPLNSFILPIGSIESSQAHIARTVVRRLERLVVSLDTKNEYKHIKMFINRLSDYLFSLGRYLGKNVY